jgi:hypothetical protein
MLTLFLTMLGGCALLSGWLLIRNAEASSKHWAFRAVLLIAGFVIVLVGGLLSLAWVPFQE